MLVVGSEDAQGIGSRQIHPTPELDTWRILSTLLSINLIHAFFNALYSSSTKIIKLKVKICTCYNTNEKLNK